MVASSAYCDLRQLALEWDTSAEILLRKLTGLNQLIRSVPVILTLLCRQRNLHILDV